MLPAAPSLEACRDELAEVLEEWRLLTIADHSPLPEMGGVRLEVGETA